MHDTYPLTLNCDIVDTFLIFASTAACQDQLLGIMQCTFSVRSLQVRQSADQDVVTDQQRSNLHAAMSQTWILAWQQFQEQDLWKPSACERHL